MKADTIYRFSLCNFSKPDSLYNYGMKPVLYSTIEAEKHYVGWSRVGNNIRYQKGNHRWVIQNKLFTNNNFRKLTLEVISFLITDTTGMKILLMTMKIAQATRLRLH